LEQELAALIPVEPPADHGVAGLRLLVSLLCG
jgi:hypothetical protein